MRAAHRQASFTGLLVSVLWLGLASGSASALPLWELTGTSNHIRVLGSIHFLRPSDYPLHPAITSAFNEADVILMEIDMGDLDPVANAKIIASLAQDAHGRRLPELLGPTAWRKATAEAHKLNLDLAPLTPFEPWYVAVMITQLRLNQLGFDQSLGVEARMTADAQRAGKEIQGFETLAGQLGILDGLSANAQRAFLQATLEEAGETADVADQMIDAWKSGDEKAMEKDMLGSVRDQQEVYRALIIRRNKNFARGIENLADDPRNYLIVVGALHLVGPDSVLRILARDGIRSRKIEGR